MLHRFGVVALTKKPFFACLSLASPHVGPMMRYAEHVGIDSSFELLEESGFPGEIDVALVAVEDAARSSEQVLDLCARGIVVIAYTPREPTDESTSLSEHGIVECPARITNAGTAQLLALHTEPELLASARQAAFRLGVGRSPDAWKARFDELVQACLSRC